VFSEQPTHEERANAFDDNVEAEGEGLDNSIFETNWDESVEKFDDLNLKEEVLRGVYGYGFERPSPIQQKAILPVLQGRDTIAQVSPLSS
jgi:superfamily II DNA/RNA helicase